MELAPGTVRTNLTKDYGGKYLTFNLGRVDYGIVITRVREIIGVTEITAMPDVPDYIQGVINLRGRVIPILDLRMKFGMEEKEHDDRTCIIVVDVPRATGVTLVGMLVDSVAEVMNIASQEIEPPPEFGATGDDDCIIGIGKVKGRLKILLDVDHVIGGILAATLEQREESAPEGVV